MPEGKGPQLNSYGAAGRSWKLCMCRLIYTWSVDQRTQRSKCLWFNQLESKTNFSASKVTSWLCGLLGTPFGCKRNKKLQVSPEDGFLS